MSDLISVYSTAKLNRRLIKDMLSAISQNGNLGLFGLKVLSPWDEHSSSLRSILERLQTAAQAELGMVLMIEEEKKRLVFCDALGLDLSLASIRNLAWSLERQQRNFPGGWDKTHVFDQESFSKKRDFHFEKSIGFKSLCFQPLGVDGQILGAVVLGNRSGTVDFSKTDIEHVASEALVLGPDLERAWLYRELKSMVINMVHAFVSTIETKDKYTCGHSERVTKYSLKMAGVLGWKQEDLDLLRMSAILHDIGKIGVPEAILLKPEKLTEKEFAIIKNHPVHGARIVEKVPQFQHALPGILFHHERFDGHGYPHGLGGMDIPEVGRLIAVADAFDAMTSSRPYRPGLEWKDAYVELRGNQGKQFDPRMVEVFLEADRQGALRE